MHFGRVYVVSLVSWVFRSTSIMGMYIKTLYIIIHNINTHTHIHTYTQSEFRP